MRVAEGTRFPLTLICAFSFAAARSCEEPPRFGVTEDTLRFYVAPLPQHLDGRMLVGKLWRDGGDKLGGAMFGPIALCRPDLFDSYDATQEVHIMRLMLESPLRVYCLDKADFVYVPIPPWVATQAHVMDNFTAGVATYLPSLKTGKRHVLACNGEHYFNFSASIIRAQFIQIVNERATGEHFLSSSVVSLKADFLQLLEERKAWAGDAVTVPYISAVHWSRGFQRPLFSADLIEAQKSKVASIFFKREFHATLKHHPFAGREVMRKDCAARPNLCIDASESLTPDMDWQAAAAVLENTTRRSWFCLQPGGDTWSRKGFWDCIVRDTIPVVFSHEYLEFFPNKDVLNISNLFIGMEFPLAKSWKRGQEPIRSYKQNIFEKLDSAVPISQRLRMLEEIGKVRQIFQWSIYPVHELVIINQREHIHQEDDAFSAMLKAVARLLCNSGNIAANRCIVRSKPSPVS